MTAFVNAKYDQDPELVKACLNGDESAWHTLVNRYARLVYSIPRHYGLSAEDSDDVFQNVFTNVSRNLASLRNRKLVAAWLITITQRECQKLFRSHAIPQVELAESTEDPSLSPPNQALNWERQHMVRQAVVQLEPKCRDLITHLFMDPQDPSYHQIASSLHIPFGSIGPTRARCFKKLEAILVDMGIQFD